MSPTENTPLGLYRPEFEHDSCGTGFLADLKGRKSHQTIADALTMLENMEHRGACGCDAESGDGAGLLLQIPHEFLMEECLRQAVCLPEPGHYGVGMLFLPRKIAAQAACKVAVAEAARKLGMPLLGYRPVPVNPARHRRNGSGRGAAD